MKTLDLQQAAEFLKLHPQTLRKKVQAGDVPGAKPGKCWVFLEADLADYLRSRYRGSGQVSQGDRKERPLCHSTDAQTQKNGGAASRHQTDRRYAALLGLTTNAGPKSTPTG